MHIQCTPVPGPLVSNKSRRELFKHQAHGGLWPGMGSGSYLKSSYCRRRCAAFQAESDREATDR